MKTVMRVWTLTMAFQTFCVLSAWSQAAKTTSFYTDRCNTLSDEIMVTIFDTGETPATVTIKVTNLVIAVASRVDRASGRKIAHFKPAEAPGGNQRRGLPLY